MSLVFCRKSDFMIVDEKQTRSGPNNEGPYHHLKVKGNYIRNIKNDDTSNQKF